MIRKLNKDDIDQVTQIWLEVNTRTHNFIPERYWTEQFNAVKKYYLNQRYMFMNKVMKYLDL